MSALCSIYSLMYADLLERVRRYSFMVVMIVSVFAGYLLVPPIEAPYTSFVIGSHRGFYNSPWVGTLFGIVACTLLALVGFYLVKNTIQRDEETRVGQIIAATPIRKPFYTLGKWLSNLAVLALILAVFTLMAPLMQYVRAEDPHIDFWALAAPIWVMGFPSLAIVSALAVLFESIPFLRGTLGNVVYFFIWGPLLVGSTVGSVSSYGLDSTPRNDFAGFSRTIISIHQQLDLDGYDTSHGVTGVVGPKMGEEIVRFTWDGIQWTSDILLERAIWMGGAIFIAFAAALPFHRFDPARTSLAHRRRRVKYVSKESQDKAEPNELYAEPHTQVWNFAHSKDLVSNFNLRCFWNVVIAEIKLMLKGQHWTWYIVIVGLFVACLASPFQIMLSYLLPIVWLWPLPLWSQMGTREKRYNTWQMIFSTEWSLQRQFPGMWIAGVFIVAITGGGAAIRFISMGVWTNLIAWGIAILFIPALALMLGVLTDSRRMFELIYLLWWYLAFNGISAFDFMGITQNSPSMGFWGLYLGLTVLFGATAFVGRWKRIQG